MIEINGRVSIPDDEVRFEASRSGGPGGQHVNTSSTKVTLVFDLAGSRALDDAAKAKISRRLATRVSTEGLLRVSVQKHRSQRMNRDEAIERFAALVRGALAEQRPRRATKPSAGSKAKRVDEKKKRGNVKKNRAFRSDD